MDSASLPDLEGLDREALKALLVKQQEELASHENELRSLEIELQSHRHTLSQQDEQLRSSSEQIEHLKLVIEKLRRRVFGVKSEKIVIQLEQLELHLEELESSQAEMQAAVERVRRDRGANRCPSICRARLSAIHFMVTLVLIAAASCASSVKMSPSSWSTSRIASR
jgi:chromosome segregation ATPase